MRSLSRTTGPVLLLLSLLALFYLKSPARADTITLLTEDGPKSMALEDYLPGALAGEMPALFPPEALKAQAVAIRSYVLAQQGRHENADVCTDPACCLQWLSEDEQRALWGEDHPTHAATLALACRATEGEYLRYGNGPALAAFHACSPGRTQNSGDLWSPLPYLVSVASPETGADVPNFASELCLSNEDLAEALELPSAELGAIVWDESGRVAEIALGGEVFSGPELRRLLGLRSCVFTVRQDETQTAFYVLGSGHGVGMSQYGAKVYAQAGLSYREILAHYYPGTELVTGTSSKSED